MRFIRNWPKISKNINRKCEHTSAQNVSHEFRNLLSNYEKSNSNNLVKKISGLYFRDPLQITVNKDVIKELEQFGKVNSSNMIWINEVNSVFPIPNDEYLITIPSTEINIVPFNNSSKILTKTPNNMYKLIRELDKIPQASIVVNNFIHFEGPSDAAIKDNQVYSITENPKSISCPLREEYSQYYETLTHKFLYQKYKYSGNYAVLFMVALKEAPIPKISDILQCIKMYGDKNNPQIDVNNNNDNSEWYYLQDLQKITVTNNTINISSISQLTFRSIDHFNITNFTKGHPFAYYIVHNPTSKVLFKGFL